MTEMEPDWFGKMVEFFTFSRGVSDIAVDAWRLKVDGLNYREIAESLTIKGTSKQDRHNKAKRLVDQALKAGLPDPKRAAAYRKEKLREANLKLIRPKNFEELSVEELALEFVKHGLTRQRLAEVLQKMKEIEDQIET